MTYIVQQLSLCIIYQMCDFSCLITLLKDQLCLIHDPSTSDHAQTLGHTLRIRTQALEIRVKVQASPGV